MLIYVQWFNVFRHKVPIETPVSYYAKMDYDSWNSILFLKEINDVDWCGYHTKVTKDMLKDMVQMLAKMHGIYWEVSSSDTHCQKALTFPSRATRITRRS